MRRNMEGVFMTTCIGEWATPDGSRHGALDKRRLHSCDEKHYVLTQTLSLYESRTTKIKSCDFVDILDLVILFEHVILYCLAK